VRYWSGFGQMLVPTSYTMWWPWSLRSVKNPGRAATVAGWMSCSSDLFVFVWFSDNRRFTVFVRFAAVVLLFFIVIVVGVSRRNCSAGEALPGGNVHGVAWGHVYARWMSRVYGGILLREYGKRRSRGQPRFSDERHHRMYTVRAARRLCYCGPLRLLRFGQRGSVIAPEPATDQGAVAQSCENPVNRLGMAWSF
jgi:hypothetical protein